MTETFSHETVMAVIAARDKTFRLHGEREPTQSSKMHTHNIFIISVVEQEEGSSLERFPSHL